MNVVMKSQEELATAAFNRQSHLFDDLYSGDIIIRYKRKRVREHVQSFLRTGSSILELNAGTGEDAIYFAKKGYHVHATDIADGMLRVLQEKVKYHQLEERISSEHCSYTELRTLQNTGPYDMIFSNFAGLNCTNELIKVLMEMNDLLKPGGLVTLVVLPKFCLWETLLLFKGKFTTATRRFRGSKGTSAHIEGQYFKCWYYSPAYISQVLKYAFDVVAVEGLCSIVPPSYMENFAEKHPGLYRFLEKKEDQLKSSWPWKYVGDYYVITLRKRGGLED